MDVTHRTARAHSLALFAALVAGCSATRDAASYGAPVRVSTLPPAHVAPAPSPALRLSSDEAAAEMARKLQNPLANIKALMTDNAIGFDTGTDGGTSIGFQLQPVYAIDFEDKGFTFIPRAVIPIMGLEPGTDAPLVGQPGGGSGGAVWGFGDSILQGFFAPHTEAEWKWGVGPQVSLPTATDLRLRGPDFGAGIAGVITGALSPDLALAVIVNNLWSFDGKFNTGSVQPALYYNLAAIPGAYVAYNAPITADWEASSSNRFTVPLGATFGRTLDMGEGNGLDLGIGPYYNVVRPDGAAGWSIRFGITWVFG